jgi:hypothetical protein
LRAAAALPIRFAMLKSFSLAAALALLTVSPVSARVPSALAKLLPSAIGVSGVITVGNDDHWYDKMLDLPHQSCGAVIYRLTSHSVSGIHKFGLDYFKTALQARGYPADTSRGWAYTYAPWMETPVPKGWIGDGPLTTYLHCGNINNVEARMIERDSRIYGSYITTKPNGALIVLPDDGIAVLGFYN